MGTVFRVRAHRCFSFGSLSVLFACDVEAGDTAAGDEYSDDRQRRLDRHVIPRHDQHLRADEGQDHGQAVLQQVEAVCHVDQQEVQGTQAQDREQVRREDDERVRRDGEDGRDRIHREDQSVASTRSSTRNSGVT
ncbi:conserved hypothetical protein, partial [Ricinus communis]